MADPNLICQFAPFCPLPPRIYFPYRKWKDFLNAFEMYDDQNQNREYRAALEFQDYPKEYDFDKWFMFAYRMIFFNWYGRAWEQEKTFTTRSGKKVILRDPYDSSGDLSNYCEIDLEKWQKVIRPTLKRWQLENNMWKGGTHLFQTQYEANYGATRRQVKEVMEQRGVQGGIKMDAENDPTAPDYFRAMLGNPAIRRMARRGGVKRISRFIYPKAKGALFAWMHKILRDIDTYVSHGLKDSTGEFFKKAGGTVKPIHVVRALKQNGRTIYGYGG